LFVETQNLKGGYVSNQKTPPVQSASQARKVRFKGIIGSVSFDKTKGGVPKMVFNIAEHPDRDNPAITTWHKNVVATRELALTLNALDPPLQPGEDIEVKAGYPYSWPYTDTNGRNRINSGINLWVVVVRGQTYAAKRQPKSDQAPSKSPQVPTQSKPREKRKEEEKGR